MFCITRLLVPNYNLSDAQCEFQIKDRLSFMDFLGINLHDKVPDENTIWHFKEQLKDKNLSQTLFDLFTDKLGEQGVIAKTGSMVDASFVDVPRQRNSKDDNDTIKAGNVPIERHRRSTRCPHRRAFASDSLRTWRRCGRGAQRRRRAQGRSHRRRDRGDGADTPRRRTPLQGVRRGT